MLVTLFIYFSVIGTGIADGDSSCATSLDILSDQASLLQGLTKIVQVDTGDSQFAAWGQDESIKRSSSTIDAPHAVTTHWTFGMSFQALFLNPSLHIGLFVVVAALIVLLMKFLPTAGLTIFLNMLISIVYILCSSALLFVNKTLIHDAKVHPIVLVTLHMFTSGLVLRGLSYIMPQYFSGLGDMKKMTSEKRHEVWRSVAMIAGCFATSLVCENSAYLFSSVAFLQMIKETGILFLVSLTLALGLDVVSPKRLSCIALIVVGACMCVRGEVHLTFWGPALQLLSNLGNGMRLTLQHKLLLHSSGLKLDPPSYVALVAPVCFAVLLLPAVAVVITHHDVLHAIRLSIGMITLDLMLAVGLNLLVAVLVQRVSAVGFVMLGAVKNALIISASFLFLGVETSRCQVLGCCMIMCSAIVYAVVRHSEEQKPVKEITTQHEPVEVTSGACMPTQST